MKTDDREHDAEASEPTTAADGTLDLPVSDRVESQAELSPGHKIGHFVIRARLGEGGMGVVLAGRDPDLGRDVAIKLVRSEVDHPAYRARLLREAQAMGRLEHPNVVRVYEIGSDRGRLFVVMELVDGITLSTWLRAQRRSWREVVAMFEQIGAGLAAVHRVGLVHRDFKPDNVLVDRDGRARVADFGLARLDPDRAGASAPSPALTATGAMMGTPGYMAPEQQHGSNVDARADQYSYCIALREALVGGRPKELDDAKWGDVPRSVRAIVSRGLSYAPEERFGSMAELMLMLGRAGTRRRAVVGGVIAALAIAGSVTAAVVVTRRANAVEPVPTPAVAEVIADAAGGADAAVVVTTAADAAVIESVPRDAASTFVATQREVTVPHKPPRSVPPGSPTLPPPSAAPENFAGSNAAPGLPRIIRAWPPAGGLPAAAEPKDRAHHPVLLATVRDLGYDGYDPMATTAGIDPSEVVLTAVANIKVGMVERRRGDCDKAVALWTVAKSALQPSLEPTWAARASLGIALCLLGGGNADEAHSEVLNAWQLGNRDEVRLVIALAVYEAGDLSSGYALFLTSSMSANARVQVAIKTWLGGTGLTLP